MPRRGRTPVPSGKLIHLEKHGEFTVLGERLPQLVDRSTDDSTARLRIRPFERLAFLIASSSALRDKQQHREHREDRAEAGPGRRALDRLAKPDGRADDRGNEAERRRAISIVVIAWMALGLKLALTKASWGRKSAG